MSVGKSDVQIRIVQNQPSDTFPNLDTETLAKAGAAKVLSIDFAKMFGSGVLHTKFWIVDNAHFYIGSANMDWRSLTQASNVASRCRVYLSVGMQSCGPVFVGKRVGCYGIELQLFDTRPGQSLLNVLDCGSGQFLSAS